MAKSNSAPLILSVLAFLSSMLALGQDNMPDESLHGDALEAADNTPTECIDLSEVKFANGESVEAYAKKRGITPPGGKEPPARPPKPKSAVEVGAKTLTGDPISLRRTIDGPANLRDKPNGKVLFSFENGHTVLLLAQANDWFLVRSYWDRPCESGWTHKKNLLPYKEARR